VNKVLGEGPEWLECAFCVMSHIVPVLIVTWLSVLLWYEQIKIPFTARAGVQ
jgi:hypothetical protein